MFFFEVDASKNQIIINLPGPFIHELRSVPFLFFPLIFDAAVNVWIGCEFLFFSDKNFIPMKKGDEMCYMYHCSVYKKCMCTLFYCFSERKKQNKMYKLKRIRFFFYLCLFFKHWQYKKFKTCSQKLSDQTRLNLYGREGET